MEKWKVVEGFEDYAVSNLGRVKRVTASVGTWPGRILKQTPASRDGYLAVGLCRNRKRHTKPVHRLVAEAFIPRPAGEVEVHHKNTNHLVNRATNLEWLTSEAHDKLNPHGSKHVSATINTRIAGLIKQRLAAGRKPKSIANELGVSLRVVYGIAYNKRWKHA